MTDWPDFIELVAHKTNTLLHIETGHWLDKHHLEATDILVQPFSRFSIKISQPDSVLFGVVTHNCLIHPLVQLIQANHFH